MKNALTPNPKAKQFSANTRKPHNRSASYGRNLNKLGRIASSEDVTQRPNLNRSKSSDGVATRKNKSFTKLTSFQSLKRTRSHQYTTRQGLGHKVTIEIHPDDEDKKDDEGEEKEEEEVDYFSDDDIKEDSKQETTTQQKLQVYKAPSQLDNAYDKPESSFVSLSRSQPHVQHIEQPEEFAQPTGDSAHRKSFIDPEKLSQITKELSFNNTNNGATTSSNDPGKEPSKEELAQYYQNMILSQSTGLVQNFNDQPFQNSLLSENIQNLKQSDFLHYIHSNDHISGALSNLKQIGTSSNSLRHFTNNNAGSKPPSSQESSPMFSFKAEPNLRMTSFTKTQPKESGSDMPSNFNSFLRSGNSNIETRTQQKLWLQRESSLLDFTAVNNSNNQANIPQIRREFERLSKEYVNNRRFENPLLESIKRVNLEKIAKSGAPSIKESSGTTAKNAMSDSTQKILLKLWTQGEKPESKPECVNYEPNNLQKYRQNQRIYHAQQQYQKTAQIHAQSNGYLAGNGLASTAPTTRAVDRAQKSPQNKRIDLSAIRLKESEQVQKLS